MRSLAAIVIGYATMVGGAWFAQEGLFPHGEYGVSPPALLIAIGIVTSMGGGLGGAMTAMLAPGRPYLHLLPMACLIALETTTLYVRGRVHGPLWFEMLAGASLIAGTLAGAWLWLRLRPRLFRGLASGRIA
jgi:hypothetical protein